MAFITISAAGVFVFSFLLMAVLIVNAASDRAAGRRSNQFLARRQLDDSGFYRALSSQVADPRSTRCGMSAVAHGGQPRQPGLMTSGKARRAVGLTAIPAISPAAPKMRPAARRTRRSTGRHRRFDRDPDVTQIRELPVANCGRDNGNGCISSARRERRLHFARGRRWPRSVSRPTRRLLIAPPTSRGRGSPVQAAGGRYSSCRLRFSFPTAAGNAAERQARLDYSLALSRACEARGSTSFRDDWNAVRVAYRRQSRDLRISIRRNRRWPAEHDATDGITTAWDWRCSSERRARSHRVSPEPNQTRLFAVQAMTTPRAGQKISAD